MIARGRDLLRAYFAAQLLLAIIGLAFIAGLAVATLMAIEMLKAATG